MCWEEGSQEGRPHRQAGSSSPTALAVSTVWEGQEVRAKTVLLVSSILLEKWEWASSSKPSQPQTSDSLVCHGRPFSSCTWRCDNLFTVPLHSVSTNNLISSSSPRRESVSKDDDHVFHQRGKSSTEKPQKELKSCKKQNLGRALVR